MGSHSLTRVSEFDAGDSSERRVAAHDDHPSRAATLLIVACEDPVALDYAQFVGARSRTDSGRERPESISLAGNASLKQRVPGSVHFCAWDGHAAGVEIAGPVSDVVVFLPARLTPAMYTRLEHIFSLAARGDAWSVMLIGHARGHYDWRASTNVEAFARESAQAHGHRTIVFRTNPVLSPRSPASSLLRKLGPWFPLAPHWLCGACVDGLELFAAIEELRHLPRTRRLYTLLGPNRPWTLRLQERRQNGFLAATITLLCRLLSVVQLGQLAALMLCLLVRFRPKLGMLIGATLKPRSRRELVALVNRFNRRHVRVVGYNNGATHFGHSYPGRTVVSTVDCRNLCRAGADTLRVDCGVTVRQARDFLDRFGQELYVIPNYSYVCLGTALFVPIHGSAADYSTIAETITEGVFFDPASDRLVRASRNDAAFRNLVFNQQSDWIVLQLRLIVKSKTSYYSQIQELTGPTAADILAALTDARAANIEIRKAHAAAAAMTVSRYYNQLTIAGETGAGAGGDLQE